MILKFNIFFFLSFFFYSLDVIVFFFACLNIETFFAKNQDQRAIRAKKISERANENCNARTRPGARDTGATVSVWHIIGLKANASQEAEKQSSFHPLFLSKIENDINFIFHLQILRGSTP